MIDRGVEGVAWGIRSGKKRSRGRDRGKKRKEVNGHEGDMRKRERTIPSKSVHSPEVETDHIQTPSPVTQQNPPERWVVKLSQRDPVGDLYKDERR